MAEGVIEVHGEALAALSAALKSSAERMDAIVSGLDRSLLVLSRQWDGAALSAYREAQAKWRRVMIEFNEELNASAASLEAAQEAYAEAARTVAGIWAVAI